MSAHEPAFATILLGAGRGRRMGTPKALLSIGGERWWITQTRHLSLDGLAPVILVTSDDALARITADAARLQADDPIRGILTTVAAPSDAPMISSILIGLQHLVNARYAEFPTAYRGIFIQPIDVPTIEHAGLHALSGYDTPACPVVEGKHGHPLFLPTPWIHRTLIPFLDNPAAAASARLDHLVNAERRFMPWHDARCTMNLNTPADLAEFVRLFMR